ncbi:MAG: serine/threonine protein kinase [Pseudomonadales bacterium]|nr:serine/threonine protein kinase [Pseudomonadales bacterium]
MAKNNIAAKVKTAPPQPAAAKGFLFRWVAGSWPAWILLVAVLVVITGYVAPHLKAFVAYWYALPEGSALAQRAAALGTAREQEVMQQFWLVGLVPVCFLLLWQLLVTLFSRSPDKAVVDQTAITQPIPPPAKSAVKDADQTIVRYTGASDSAPTKPVAAKPAPAQSVTAMSNESLVSLDELLGMDGGVSYIGANRRYRIDRFLASGGMGSVHKGFDTLLQRDVAIKELDVNVSQDPQQTERFHQEALALAGLTHPHIVQIYDLVIENNRFWMVMELLPGGDLDRYLEDKKPSVKVATNIIRAVAEGLAFAHNKGIIHRDIKPMNILFNADGIPKLVDFGIAKLVQSTQSNVHTSDGLSLGSPTYMSPEQAAGSKQVDKRTDIYALGITFYKMLTGDAPFTGDVAAVMAQHITQAPQPPVAHNAAISELLNNIVLKMLAKKPEDRFQSLEEFIAALDALRKAEAV